LWRWRNKNSKSIYIVTGRQILYLQSESMNYSGMTNKKDIRWEQRFSNYNKALKKLSDAITFIKEDSNNPIVGSASSEEVLDEIIKEGLIQRFEYTHELAWNVMRDFLTEVGDVRIYGSKDATREAFQAELIENGDVWMEMIFSRNKTSHTYNEETADEIYSKILNEYHSAFLKFQQVMENKKTGEQKSLFD
jgi:nucleotidyltransferase substrate binding protein (TIGR01987 family)